MLSHLLPQYIYCCHSMVLQIGQPYEESSWMQDYMGIKVSTYETEVELDENCFEDLCLNTYG